MDERLVLFGGTFDPIHNGHIQLGTYLAKCLNSAITFMPNGIPPYKSPPIASNIQRLEMLQLIASQNKLFRIDTREINSKSYSYTYQTLQNIRHEYGNNIPIFFVMGEDSLVTFDTWENYEQILEMVNLIVVNRINYNISQLKNPKLRRYIKNNSINNLDQLNFINGKIYLPSYTPDNISSTNLRKLLKENMNHEIIKSMIPSVIYEYIIKHKIYQN